MDIGVGVVMMLLLRNNAFVDGEVMLAVTVAIITIASCNYLIVDLRPPVSSWLDHVSYRSPTRE